MGCPYKIHIANDPMPTAAQSLFHTSMGVSRTTYLCHI